MPHRIKIALLISLFVTGSCQKKTEPVACYECVMIYASGLPGGIQYPCTQNIAQWQEEQKDTNGQPMQSTCTKQ